MWRKRSAAHLAVLALLLASAAQVSAQNAAWLQQIKQLVASKQTYPRVAQMRGVEGRAIIKVYFDPEGQIGKVDLIKSTGSALLDHEAVSVFAKIGKFPKPPGGVQSVDLPITWKLL